ncbi:hypothetical protein Tco_0355590 [Tanacetum coccineum]
MSNVKKSVAERTRHKRLYDRRVNKRQMQKQESKVDLGKELDVGLVVMESNGTELEVQDDSSRSWNETDADDADIRTIYDKEPMAEVQLTAKCNISAIGQHHTKQPEIINEGRVDQYPEQCQDKSPILDSSPDNQTTEYSKQSLDSDSRKVFAIASLKNELRKLKGNSVDTKFAKTSVLGKPVLQSLRNQSVVRKLNAFKSERPQMSKQRFASQVDVNNNLSRPVTQHYFPKRIESVFAKPDHMISSSESRNSSKNMPRFSLNDMVHNHYLDEARKKTQENDRNSKTSVMPSARFQSIDNDSKPKPRSTNHSTRSLLVSKSGCVTITDCVFNANHDACITKLLKEVNLRAKIQSHKTRNTNKPVDQKSHTQKPGRQIITGHRFSPNKTSAVYEKTSPRSDLRWKPTGRIFKSVGLRWVPTGKILASCTSKDDSEPTHGSNIDIPNIYECKQTFDLSTGTSLTGQQKQRIDFSAGTSFNVKQENLRVWLLKKLISQNQCHNGFTNDEIAMTFEHNSSSLKPQCQMMFEQIGSSLALV